MSSTTAVSIRSLFLGLSIACLATVTPALSPAASVWGSEQNEPVQLPPLSVDAMQAPSTASCVRAVTLDDNTAVWSVAELGSPVADHDLMGEAQEDWTYPVAALFRLDHATGQQVLVRQWAAGVFLPTDVEVQGDRCYVAGYASPGMLPLVATVPGLRKQADWAQRTWTTWCPPEHHSEPRRSKAVDQRGVPCVLQLDRNGQIIAATFLEGWQSTWFVPGMLRENVIEKVHLSVLSDGDVIVSHDGGYNKAPTVDEECSFEHFYAVPNHVSRLSPDLSVRRWLHTWSSPHTDPTKVITYLHNSQHFTMMHGTPTITEWPYPYLGNPRVFAMQLDGSEQIILVGWSPTRTAGEPWWSPFVVILGADGVERQRLYNPDPMSGKDHRMNGLVSDGAVRTVALGEPGQLLFSVIGDGGNNVMRRHPKESLKNVAKGVWRGGLGPFSGRHLFWGGITVVDVASGDLLRGRYLAGAQPDVRKKNRTMQQDLWATDIVRLADGRVAVLGRYRGTLRSSKNAWTQAPVLPRSYGWCVQLWSADLQKSLFCSALPGWQQAGLHADGDGESVWLFGQLQTIALPRLAAGSLQRLHFPLPTEPEVVPEK